MADHVKVLRAFRAGKNVRILDIDAAVDAAIAALESPLPAGWVAVPVSATAEMESAGDLAYLKWENGHCVEPIYAAMIAAAPKLAGEEK